MKPAARTLTAVCLSVVAIAAIAYYGSHDPSTDPSPRCVFKSLTGYDCPGCGSQRAIHALLNGDFETAWHYNPFMFALVPVGVVYALLEIFPERHKRLRGLMMHPATIITLCLSIIAWWIFRNF